MKHIYTHESLKELVESSTSVRQVLFKLKLAPAGGNYATIKTYIKKFNLDTSHFKGHGWSKGVVLPPKKPIESYLVKGSRIQSFCLKKKLIREKVFEHKCMNCKKSRWLGKVIPIELHHKDGDSSNNELSNLEILCYNCHGLTPNFRGKNKKK